MPYIDKSSRAYFDKCLEELFKSICEDTQAGTLNYIITKIFIEALGETPNYKRFNEIVGVLECCKLELYRRLISKYEDKKIEESGDVYE